VKLGGQAVDEVRRRVQQAINGQRGRKGDPLYGIRNLLRCGQERLTDRQQIRLAKAIDPDERHLEVFVAWQCAQQLRQVYHQTSSAEGRRLATKIIDSFPSCPIPEISSAARPSTKSAAQQVPDAVERVALAAPLPVDGLSRTEMASASWSSMAFL